MEPDKEHIQYTLFSLSDTRGAAELARFLQDQSLRLMATSSTARFLRDNGLEVENISDFTGAREILDGRVKTLDPKVHGSLLYLRQEMAHVEESRRSELRDIRVVVVNLYPFARAASSSAANDEANIIENIDIGGPSMLRSAAKNYQSISVLCQPGDYSAFMREWRENGHIALATRRCLAAKVYSHTAHYDAMISAWFNQLNGELFPEKLLIAGERRQIARYGENPHQAGAIYQTPAAGSGLVTQCQQMHGKEMSYNNFLDAEAALGFLRLFRQRAVIIVKHQNACGAAIGREHQAAAENQASAENQAPAENMESIYDRALACDTDSAFGGVVAVNRAVDLALAEKLSEIFYEIVLAPSFTEAALAKLQSKKNLRILQIPGPTDGILMPSLDFRALSGGFAIQKLDESLKAENEMDEIAGFRCVSKVQATDHDLQELLFAWKIASRVKSNAIVFSRDFAAPGIGAGQMSRIDAVKIAAQKMINMGFPTEGSYMASDAFLPFRDTVDQAAAYGARAIIHPGGSIRDREVIEAADEHGIIIVCTGVRHFYH